MEKAIYLARDQRPLPRRDPASGAWFAEKDGVTEAEAAQAFQDIEAWAKKHFGAHITMQRTPTFFGMQLLQNALPFDEANGHPYHYETMPDPMIDLLKEHTFPHRIERLHKVNAGKPWEYDQRLAFLAMSAQVPIYHPSQFNHDEKNVYIPYHQAWYLCDVTVPGTWQKIGLVPNTFQISVTSRIYPRTPGTTFTTWLHESEMALLTFHEWRYRIAKRILFAPAGAGDRPLVLWRKKLIEGIENAERMGDVRRWRLFRIALRHVALNTIGQFGHVGTNTARTERTPDGSMVTTGGDPVSGLPRRWIHPEWAGAIYARARVAATEVALKVPLDLTIGINGDAVYSAQPLPITDSGKVGSYRLKGVA